MSKSMRVLLILLALTTPAAATFGLSAFTAEAASLHGIINQLRAQCGAEVISGYRNTRIYGGSMSCHAMGQAADMRGNYACMYRVLKSWPGGYSTDAGRCRHIHVSSCKREWGMRFKHRTC